MDEYGRKPGHPLYDDETRRSSEFRQFQKSKLEWSKRRFGKPIAHVENQMGEDSMGDVEMDWHLREAGLLPPEEKMPPQDVEPES